MPRKFVLSKPITLKIACSAISCTAMYGMVAMMPTMATMVPTVREPNRARANSAAVTKPCAWATDQIRVLTRKTSGTVQSANGIAKKPNAPTP